MIEVEPNNVGVICPYLDCRKQVWFYMKEFVSRLLNPDVSLGASDYYVPMLFFDILCLLTMVFGVSSFGVGYLVNTLIQ